MSAGASAGELANLRAYIARPDHIAKSTKALFRQPTNPRMPCTVRAAFAIRMTFARSPCPLRLDRAARRTRGLRFPARDAA